MSQVRLILALHNHQPVGNFDGVFEDAYRTSYLPFLDVLEGYPEIPFALHTSGPLLEWLVERHPEYIARLRRMVESGRVEILGGGFFEPILTMIPHRDRVGQIRGYSRHLEELLGARVRGMWIAERVWEQALVSSIAEAGIEYTILDDCHFLRAGCPEDDVLGYYLTEDDGRLLKVFPGSEPLRYMIPFQRAPRDLRIPAQAGRAPARLDHRLRRRRREVRVLAQDLRSCLSERLAESLLRHAAGEPRLAGDDDLRAGPGRLAPLREGLPAGRLVSGDDGVVAVAGGAGCVSPGVAPAGRDARCRRDRAVLPAWRLLAELQGEVCRMRRDVCPDDDGLAPAGGDGGGGGADPDYLEVARQELYRGQCNCPYWHGSFGGLYLPHLRNAIYRSLIAADNALDDAEGRTGPRVALEVADFNLDARQEVRLENDHLIAMVRPAQGGHLYELDVRGSATNVLATLDRRPEPYHEAIREATARLASGQEPGSVIDPIRIPPNRSGSSSKGSTDCSSMTGIRARRWSTTSTQST